MEGLQEILRIIIDKFEERPIGSIVIFSLTLIGIAYIADTMLFYTFPALTLITLIAGAGVIASRLYENHLISKNVDETIEDFKNFKI